MSMGGGMGWRMQIPINGEKIVLWSLFLNKTNMFIDGFEYPDELFNEKGFCENDLWLNDIPGSSKYRNEKLIGSIHKDGQYQMKINDIHYDFTQNDKGMICINVSEKRSITAYKITEKNMRCRNIIFNMTDTFTQDGTIQTCANGFHSCISIYDCLEYYDAVCDADLKFFEVKIWGMVMIDLFNNKCCSENIKFIKEIPRSDVFISSRYSSYRGIAYFDDNLKLHNIYNKSHKLGYYIHGTPMSRDDFLKESTKIINEILTIKKSYLDSVKHLPKYQHKYKKDIKRQYRLIYSAHNKYKIDETKNLNYGISRYYSIIGIIFMVILAWIYMRRTT